MAEQPTKEQQVEARTLMRKVTRIRVESCLDIEVLRKDACEMLDGLETIDHRWLDAEQRLTTTEQQLAEARQALQFAERFCPCGARPESLNTHPHTPGCLIAKALGSATVATIYEKAVRPGAGEGGR